MADLGFIDDLWFDRREELDEGMRLVDLIKASFGGDRSAAGRYAAEQRWKGHVKKQPAAPSSRSALPKNLKTQLSLVGDAMEKVRRKGVTTTVKSATGAFGGRDRLPLASLEKELDAMERRIDRLDERNNEDLSWDRITEKEFYKIDDRLYRMREAHRLAVIAVNTLINRDADDDVSRQLLVSRDADGKLEGLAVVSVTQDETETRLPRSRQSVVGRAMLIDFLVSFQGVPGMGRALFGEALKQAEGKNVRVLYLETTEDSRDYWERMGFKSTKSTRLAALVSGMNNYHTLEVPLDDMTRVLP